MHPDIPEGNATRSEWLAIVQAWDNMQAARERDAAEREEWLKKGQWILGRRRLRERAPMRRFALAEVMEIFSLSSREVLSRRFDGTGMPDRGGQLFLPDPVPSAMQSEYELLWDTLLDILVRYDLAGIVYMGAPREQYDTELTMIMPRLRDARSSEEVTCIVREEFSGWFSPNTVGTLEQQQAAGRDLWAAWQASGAPRWWRRLFVSAPRQL